MGRRNSLTGVLLVLIIAAVVLIYSPYAELDLSTEYLQLLPSLILIVVAVYGAKGTRGFNQVFAFILVGVGLAMMAGQLNGLGVLIPDIIVEYPTLTVAYIQALIVVVSAIVGAAVSR